MKRLLITLVLLAVVAGVVFFFGWVQFQLPPDANGVIFTKTNGWEEAVVAPGEFVWRWQRLLPTNLTLYVFELQPHQTSVALSGSLPSADTFESILGSSASFSYELNLEVVSRIPPEELPRLAETEDLRPEGLDQYYEAFDARITQIATDTVLGLLDEDPEMLSVGTTYSLIADAVDEMLASQLTGIEILSVSPTRIELPDMELYRAARDLSDELITARADALAAAARESAAAQQETERQLLMLERYGEILTRYPVLLEYFQLGRDIESDPLNLGDIVPPTAQ
jgi:hypothetical protein